MPLVAGRMFDERDKADAPPVVMIGKNLADRVFAGRDPIGRKLRYAGVQAPPITVVGVIGDVKITGLDDALRPVLYYPFRQSASPFANLVVRTSAEYFRQLRETVMILRDENRIAEVVAEDDGADEPAGADRGNREQDERDRHHGRRLVRRTAVTVVIVAVTMVAMTVTVVVGAVAVTVCIPARLTVERVEDEPEGVERRDESAGEHAEVGEPRSRHLGEVRRRRHARARLRLLRRGPSWGRDAGVTSARDSVFFT